jgi:asparagine synthase (glutamine-hydrolysing)
MCGIAGKVWPRHEVADAALVRRMTAVLRHRGPDDEGIWVQHPVGLGSRRLAVIDLSCRARQPITNEDGSLHVVFNGEIYNFSSLRQELERKGHRFRSDTDTEALVHLYEEEGVECLRHLRGMFAFALWDAPRQTLFLARDRLGKKPLFYRHDGEGLVFASEPKAILQDPSVRAEPDLAALDDYLTYGYVPSPWSAFRGLRKLPPAHYLLARGADLTVERYWSLRHRPVRTEPEPALLEEFLALLEDAVRLRLVSDVPLGALLSGGLDSSTVVALMRRLTSGPVRTFSIGFDRPEYDELVYARQVARHLETEHHELVLKPDAVSLLPRLVWHYDEPFADSSALPAMWLCEMAREFVTVALSGDGGDETFAGYDRYRAARVAGWSDAAPLGVRRTLGRALSLLPPGPPKSVRHGLRRFGDAIVLDARRRYGRWLTVVDDDTKAELYTREFAAEVAGNDPLALLDAAYTASDAPSFVGATMHADVQLYLPDDLLVKMDIASMAHSLEVRSPLLDHQVVEFAARLPLSLKLRGLTQKYLVKRAMRGVLPDRVLRRRKMGFAVPIDHWFRDELRELAYDVLLDRRATARGYFRPGVVRRYLDEHVAGTARHHAQLWALLGLELWHRLCLDAACPASAPTTL